MEKIICQERTMNGADGTQLMEEGCLADIVSYGATNKPLTAREL
jgi:hypothetical protein